MFIPRKPGVEEVQKLRNFLVFELAFTAPEDKEAIDSWIENAAIAVFDDYITDSPGYTGRVMVVVWPAGPDSYEVYTFDKEGEIQKEYQDPVLQK